MAATITNASALNSDQVRQEFYREYTHGNTLRWLMGNATKPIHMLSDFSKKRGDQIQVPFLDALSNDPILGSAQAEGNGENLSWVADAVLVDLVRAVVKVEDVQMSEQRAPFAVFESVRPQLIDAVARNFRNLIIDELGDLSEGDSQNRRLYGAADSNYNATEATALANIDTTNDKMTTEIIDIAVEKARLGGNTSGVTKSHKIRPFRVAMDNGAIDDMFVMLLHPTAARQLRADPDFQNAGLFRTERDAPKLVSGSRYLGNWNGCLLYVLDELDRLADGSQPIQGDYTRTDLTTAGASSTGVVHNILLGAQAVAVANAGLPEFKLKESDFGRIKEVCVTEIYGVEKLVFNSVDNGCVHVFTSVGA